MLGWRKHKLESRLPGEISITSDMQMAPPLWKKVKNYDPEGWYGEGGGRRVQDMEHMYTCGRFILIFGKTNTIM